ncbi:aminotransferase class I/II-fold pyridoxal phosphate-dependent enzyme [Yimella sp. RIT 621]|uniref:pyridoxal phosphate-dependent decarboxylase family protein n=1 Tax=unclassified Yimella TaxID=2649892 RepID=UPI00101CECBA|nr:aminotransferase class I/II-fold pyridoxal phosphate-dependent enzyme [Yimella sp. RIT 621]MCG8656239.1 aminotransferase class I/II-fold pyridoxal phosphate-dependent enzyme [Yimella sp. NH-Cas1]RYG77565.1 aminotransferase class I/II-fold pyridoxal phosphate-dependent enzyme [Yimella sp. RIT 621]
MHQFDEKTQQLSDAIAAYADNRLKLNPVPLDGVATPQELQELVGQTITREGMGGLPALELFTEQLAPKCLSIDHPRYLSFIPSAPTREAAMFDLVVGASALYAGSWLEGSGAVYAENQALRWIADLVGLPPTAGGQFVQGGTIGNLSALVAARDTARALTDKRPYRVAATFGSHSSIETACKVMDAELVKVPVDDWQLTGDKLREVLEENGPDTFFAVVATAGTTNFGIIDDIDSVADVCDEYGIWLHVDGAYGGAGLAAPSVREKYDGIERCNSFIVDPHKWFFAPFDCCALIYREPMLGRAAHTQHASYLDVLTGSTDWNPSDFSIGLTRRARGLPFWFSLVVNGTDAYTEAIERTLEVARFANEEIKKRPYVELVREGSLTVVVFRRLGWSAADYQRWSDDLLEREEAFVVPTSHEGETLARFAIVNPLTSEDDITAILDTMA